MKGLLVGLSVCLSSIFISNLFQIFFRAAIKTIKQIFFQCLLQFSTLAYKSILDLVAQIYNNKPHRGIYSATPFSAHFHSHVASKIARKNAAQRTDRQRNLRRSIFSTKPDNIFAVNDRVLLKAKKTHFQKHNPFDFPSYQKGIFTISAVHDRIYPKLYSLAEKNPHRKFYGFELVRLDKSFDQVAQQQKERQNTHHDRIIVRDIIREEPTQLRSGRILENGRQKIKYKVEKGGRTNFVDEPGLKVWKRALGDGAIEYDKEQFFPSSWKSRYII